MTFFEVAVVVVSIMSFFVALYAFTLTYDITRKANSWICSKVDPNDNFKSEEESFSFHYIQERKTSKIDSLLTPEEEYKLLLHLLKKKSCYYNTNSSNIFCLTPAKKVELAYRFDKNSYSIISKIILSILKTVECVTAKIAIMIYSTGKKG